METHGNTSKIEFKIKCHHCTYARVEGRSYFFPLLLSILIHTDESKYMKEMDAPFYLFILLEKLSWMFVIKFLKR